MSASRVAGRGLSSLVVRGKRLTRCLGKQSGENSLGLTCDRSKRLDARFVGAPVGTQRRGLSSPLGYPQVEGLDDKLGLVGEGGESRRGFRERAVEGDGFLKVPSHGVADSGLHAQEDGWDGSEARDKDEEQSEDSYGHQSSQVSSYQANGRDKGAQALTERAYARKLFKMSSKIGKHTPKTAMAILEDARSRGIKGVLVYNAALKLMAWSRNPKEAEEVLELMIEDGIQPDIHTFNNMIHTCANNKDVEGALRHYQELLGKEIEPTVHTFSYLITTLATSNPTEAHRMMDHLQEKQMIPLRSAYYTMFNLCKREQAWNKILKMMGSMLESGLGASRVQYLIAIRAATALGMPLKAVELLEDMKGVGFMPASGAYHQIMVSFNKKHMWKESLYYWRELVCTEESPNIIIHKQQLTTALKTAGMGQQWEEVEAIVGMIEDRGVEKDQHMYHTLLSTLSKFPHNAGELMEAIFDEMEATPGMVPYPIHLIFMLGLYFRKQQHRKVLGLYDRLVENMVLLSSNIYRQVFSSMNCVLVDNRSQGASIQVEDVKKAWLRMKREGCEPGQQIQNILLKIAGAAKDRDWIMDVLGNAREWAINGLVSDTLYSRAITALGQANCLEEALTVFEECKSRKGPVDTVLYNCIISVCVKNSDPEGALRLLEEMQQPGSVATPDSVTVGLCMQTLLGSGRASTAMELFERFVANGFKPDSICCGNAGRVAQVSGNIEAARRICKMTVSMGQSPSPSLLEFAGLTDELEGTAHKEAAHKEEPAATRLPEQAGL